MDQKLIIQDLVIVVAAKNHKTTILNPDFLSASAIVPLEWQLARQPIYTNNLSQVTFSNGVSIIAEPNRVMFMEPIADKSVGEISIPEIARKYVQTLPNMEIEALGVNPRGYIPLKGSSDAARDYVTQTLLSPGAWQEEGEAPMRASLNLVYKYSRAPFYLNVTEAALRQDKEDEIPTPIVMFSGSFSYEMSGSTTTEKFTSLQNCLENWQTDLQAYSELINNKFLSKIPQETVVIPEAATELLAMSASV